jgi:Tol biopolymer transport system component
MVARPGDDAQTPATTPSLAPSPPPLELEPDVQDVAAMRLDGVPFAAVPNIPQDAGQLDLSPDGTTLAFTTAEGISTIGIDGSDLRLINDGDVGAPAWSPNGTEIAFERVAGSGSNLFVMNADGSNQRQLTTHDGWIFLPRWAPDGRTIAYVAIDPEDSDTDPQFADSADIWSVPATGGEPTNITDSPGPDTSFDFSPDGERIVYYHDERLFLMNADGSRPRPLTTSWGYTPSWSPDGATIAYGVYDSTYRSDVDLAGNVNPDGWPILRVSVVDVATGEIREVGDVATVYDYNPPIWLSSDELLVRRVGTI